MWDVFNKIIKSLIIISIILIICAFVYVGVTAFTNRKSQVNEELYKFLSSEVNDDRSIIYGLLNYNFDKIDSNVDASFLARTNFMYNSEAGDDIVDEVYLGITGMNRLSYINDPKYLATPSMNCYYAVSNLNKKYDCSVCSKGEVSVIAYMTKTLGMSNSTSYEANVFCKKDTYYPINTMKYEEIIVDLNKLKELFRKYTNKNLEFGSDITTNKYYKYNAFSSDINDRLEDNISKINKIVIEDISGDEVIFTYKAITQLGEELDGKAKFGILEDGFYVKSNEIGASNYIN